MTGTQIFVPLIPPKVQAAQAFCHFCEGVRRDSDPLTSRDLTAEESQAYNAAVEILLLYFRGENDYLPTVNVADDDSLDPVMN